MSEYDLGGLGARGGLHAHHVAAGSEGEAQAAVHAAAGHLAAGGVEHAHFAGCGRHGELAGLHADGGRALGRGCLVDGADGGEGGAVGVEDFARGGVEEERLNFEEKSHEV